MVTRRINSLVEEFEQSHLSSQAEEEIARRNSETESEFLHLWNTAYSPALFQSAEFIPETVAGLLRLREPINQRLWEYNLVSYLHHPSLIPAALIGTELLLESVFCDADSLSASLHRILETRQYADGLMTEITRCHPHIYRALREMEGRRFFTPEMDRRQCAKMFGMTMDKFYYELKTGRVVDMSEDARRYKRKGRWLHQDPEIQQAGLRRILKVFPKLVWSNDS